MPLRARLLRHLLSVVLTLQFLVSAGFGSAPAADDLLVYKDGDRLQGRLISNEGGTIVFRSNRFGELRVPVAQADVIRDGANPAAETASANQPKPLDTAARPAAKAAPGDKSDSDLTEQRQFVERFATKLRQFFGPWHGRIAFSSQVANESSGERQTEVLEGKMERKWTGDELRFEGRYEFSSTNNTTSKDLTKGSAYWRHDLSKRWFSIVQPSVEWNQHYIVDGASADYFLVQTELGGGRTVWDRPGKKLRIGLAENLYYVWELDTAQRTFRNVESLFIEAEFRLPWSMKLTERGIRYFSILGGHNGWESQFELSKKFSENLVLALRNDVRAREPESRVADYSSWRLLLGLDF